MPEIDKSVLVPYSAAQMYALVEDIEAYPEFLPWCAGAELRRRDGNAVDATIEIRFRGIERKFTTHNTLVPNDRIDMELVDGPFSALSGGWSFTELTPTACKVQLRLQYTFSSRLLEGLVGPVFQYIGSTFVEGFTKRAKSLYG